MMGWGVGVRELERLGGSGTLDWLGLGRACLLLICGNYQCSWKTDFWLAMPDFPEKTKQGQLTANSRHFVWSGWFRVGF